MWAIKRLRQYLFVIPLDIYADHSPLTSLLRVGASIARVQRRVEFLTAYTYRIIHRKGAARGNADMLSRLCQPATEANIQSSCSITNLRIMQYFSSGPVECGREEYLHQLSTYSYKLVSQDRGYAWVGSSVPQTPRMTKVEIGTSINGYEDVRNMHSTILLQPGERVLRQKELPVCIVQRYCNTRTSMVAAVIAAQCKPR